MLRILSPIGIINARGLKDPKTLGDQSFMLTQKMISGILILILFPDKQIWQLVMCKILIKLFVLYYVQTNFETIVILRTILGSAYKVIF